MTSIWDLNDDKWVIVKLNAQRILIGEEATKITQFICSMLRMLNFALITYTTWHEFPNSIKEGMPKTINVLNLIMFDLNFSWFSYMY